MLFIKYYVTAFILFFLIDMLWLGIIAKPLYAQQVGFLMADEVRWGAALLFYSLYIVGLVVFVIQPAAEASSWLHAVLYGAGFGLICYATFDLTNLALIKNWPLPITVYDMLWGTFISGSTSVMAYFIGRILKFQ